MKRSSIAPHSSCQSRLNVDVRLLRLHVSARSRREPCWRSVPDDLGANNGDGRLILDYRNPERDFAMIRLAMIRPAKPPLDIFATCTNANHPVTFTK
jgi:hypothetical protein